VQTQEVNGEQQLNESIGNNPKQEAGVATSSEVGETTETERADDPPNVTAVTTTTTTTAATASSTTPAKQSQSKPFQPKQQRKSLPAVLSRALPYQPQYYPSPMPYYYPQAAPVYGANWSPYFPPPREPYPAFYSPFPDVRRYRSAPLLPVPKRAPLKGCEVCGIPNFTSMQQLTAHMTGKKHLAKANPSSTSTVTTTSTSSPAATASVDPFPNANAVIPKILARPKSGDAVNSLSPPSCPEVSGLQFSVEDALPEPNGVAEEAIENSTSSSTEAVVDA
jgi:hypothetical protein